MATTMGPRSGGRSRASNGQDGTTEGERDQYDLLTAAMLGVVAGAGIALLFRGRRKRTPGALAREAKQMAGAAVGRAGRRGAKWAASRSEQVMDLLPVEEIAESVGEYVKSARDAIDDTVSHEMRDLRKAIRRHRKHLGI
jgi:gas vesicle protein